MDKALRNGLTRHEQIVGELRYFSIDRERILKICRMIDELMAAVAVQHLEMAPPEQEEARKKIRAAYESRWMESL